MLDRLPATYGFFQAYRDGCMILDVDSKIIAASLEAHRIFGYGHGELYGLSVNKLIAPGQDHPHNKRLPSGNEVLSTGKGKEINVSGVVQGVNKDGKIINVDIYHRMRYRVGDRVYYAALMKRA